MMKTMTPTRRLLRPLALLALMALPTLSSAQGDAFQVRAKTILLEDGSALENGLLLVRDGKIVSVGPGDSVDADLPLFEHDGVLSAGLVACQSASGAGQGVDDRTRSVLPEARVADAVAFQHSDFERALAAGITSMVITPSGANLSGGLTTVVKASGGKLLKREGHLAISFSSEALGRSKPTTRFFFGRAENGTLENTKSTSNGERLPTSYAGAKRMLADLLKDKSNEKSAFARAARGELPVLFEAWDRNEVVRAARFATEHGLKGALRGAPLGGDPTVTRALKASGLGVIVGPFGIGQSKRSLESAVTMLHAGIPLAFALDAPSHDPASFRLSAALTASAGAEPAAMLASMTHVAAQLAGVADRVGSLKPGMDADFVLWSGHPVNLASSVQAVYVDGKLAWRQPKKDGESR